MAHVFKSAGFVCTNGGAVQEMDIATLDRRIFARLHLRHALSHCRRHHPFGPGRLSLV
jgi:hypothetical protein